jgi:hypothetical protein
MAGPGGFQAPQLGHPGIYGLGTHHPFPAHVVAVGDPEHHGRTQGFAAAHAGADFSRIFLDLHPPPAAEAVLAAGEVAGQDV